jgi:hypothetical protein
MVDNIESIAMIGIWLAAIGGILFWYRSQRLQTEPEKETIEDAEATVFSLSALSNGWFGGNRGKFELPVTDKGIWIGLTGKKFHAFSEITSVKIGLLNRPNRFENRLSLKNGKTYYFSFFNVEQKDAFFEILKKNGVQVAE